MRYIFVFFFLSFGILNAQVFDDFSDGDFTNNPEWIGLTELFRVDPATMSLQLYAPAEARTTWLFTESQSIENASWQFYFKMNFNPSGTNYCTVYLTADYPDINQIKNAYYLVLGTADDNICLWERRNGTNKRLIQGISKRLDMSVTYGLVKVRREKNNTIILESNITDGGWIEEGRYLESIGMFSNYFGLCCIYTSTRSKNFYFDDIEVKGTAYKDTILPEITEFSVINRYKFRLKFSKFVDILNFEENNFTIESSGKHPDEILVNDLFTIDLLYNESIALEDEQVLTVKNISDKEGNVMKDANFPYKYQPTIVTKCNTEDSRNITFQFSRAINFEKITKNNFRWKENGCLIENIVNQASNIIKLELISDLKFGQMLYMYLDDILAVNGDTIDKGPYLVFIYQPERNDIIISEIMTDPDPPIELPNSEFIELYNRSQFPIQLEGFQLQVGNGTNKLKEHFLFPNEYLILVPNPQNDNWSFVPNRMAVTSWHALPNSSGEIVLYDKNGKTINALQYSTSMAQTGFKQDGGWSLEIIDANNFSGDWDNFDFSINCKGGTPGFVNSISAKYPDVKHPELNNWFVEDTLCLVMEFSEPMNPEKLPYNCSTTPNNIDINSITIEEPFLKTIMICFSNQIPENKIYELSFSEKPEDLAGNQLLNADNFLFGVPVAPQKDDVIINELLYNPPTGGSDFVELYNRSDNLIDLSKLYLSRNLSNEVTPEKLIKLAEKSVIFFPKTFIAFTADKYWLIYNYHIENVNTIKNVSSLPNFVNGKGIVFLTNIQGEIFEQFDYNDKMHFTLLRDTKGVSLERINFDTPAGNTSNWHSAAAECGYATPGRANSQAHIPEKELENDFVLIEPSVFTPNNDGIDDLLFICYRFDKPGNTCTVKIFNRSGQVVRNLQNNSLAGTEGFFVWDGLNDSGQRCSSDIYIIWFRSFNMNGNIKETKKTAVLGYGRN